jgi:hypothetical protein
MTPFDTFWQAYPRHVGKLAAMKAYAKALRLASAEQILAGVEVYKRIKPPYADWAHASSWLNAGRWMDEPDAQPAARRPQATQHVGQGPSPRDLELIAEWEREHKV